MTKEREKNVENGLMKKKIKNTNTPKKKKKRRKGAVKGELDSLYGLKTKDEQIEKGVTRHRKGERKRS